jgi:hypothetical protein
LPFGVHVPEKTRYLLQIGRVLQTEGIIERQ